FRLAVVGRRFDDVILVGVGPFRSVGERESLAAGIALHLRAAELRRDRELMAAVPAASEEGHGKNPARDCAGALGIAIVPVMAESPKRRRSMVVSQLEVDTSLRDAESGRGATGLLQTEIPRSRP